MVKFDQGFVRPISGVISEPGRGANLGRVRLKLAGNFAECHTTERLSPPLRLFPKSETKQLGRPNVTKWTERDHELHPIGRKRHAVRTVDNSAIVAPGSRDPAGSCNPRTTGNAIFLQPSQQNAITGNAVSYENRLQITWNIVGFVALSVCFDCVFRFLGDPIFNGLAGCGSPLALPPTAGGSHGKRPCIHENIW